MVQVFIEHIYHLCLIHPVFLMIFVSLGNGKLNNHEMYDMYNDNKILKNRYTFVMRQ